MEALRGAGADLGMALAAGLFRIGKGGVFDQAGVGGLPVGVVRIAAMAVDAGDLPVICFQKGLRHINLLVRLQRSQRPPSALALVFRRKLGFAADFLDFPAQADKLLDIGVALHASADGRFLTCQGMGQTQDGNGDKVRPTRQSEL